MADRAPIRSPAAAVDETDALLSYVEYASSLVGLDLRGERARAVATAFATYRAAAALMMDMPLPDDSEPASVYTLENS
jgi:hypothetical protein